MNLNEYQELAMRTAKSSRTYWEQLANFAIGLGGEAGEAQELIKKYLFHGKQLESAAVIKELGDVLWYITALAGTLNISLDEIAATNIEKLKSRYPNGFSIEDSLKRKE